jgi:hypothetical protein
MLKEPRMSRHRLPLVAVMALAFALAGCAPTAENAEPPQVSATPTPTPTTEPPVVTTIVMTASELQLLNEDGDTLQTFEYFVNGDDASALEALTALLGDDPETRTDEAATHFPRMTSYTWDDFTLVDTEPRAGGSYPEVNEFYVYATAPLARGISVRTEEGVSVGTPVSDIDTSKPMAESRESADSDIVETLYGIERIDVEDLLNYDAGYPPFIAVSAWTSNADDLVYRLQAPVSNFGA